VSVGDRVKPLTSYYNGSCILITTIAIIFFKLSCNRVFSVLPTTTQQFTFKKKDYPVLIDPINAAEPFQ
jgi:hypothetical protein